MQKVHNLAQRFLGFILSGYVFERLAGFCRNIDLGIGFAEGHRIGTHLFCQLLGEQLANTQDDDDRHQPHQHIHKERILLRNHRGILGPALFQTIRQRRIVRHNSGDKDIFLIVFDRIGDLSGLIIDFNFIDLLFIQSGKQIAVADFLDSLILNHRRNKEIKRHQSDQHHKVIIN